ncbi:hypothetical protein ACA910_000317 [Epithemia clementina (nom. ined.)]
MGPPTDHHAHATTRQPLHPSQTPTPQPTTSALSRELRSMANRSTCTAQNHGNNDNSNSITSNRPRACSYVEYARQLALLTIVTAYLGNHAASDNTSATTSSGTTLFGLGLYGDSIVPRLVYSKEIVVYMVCLYWIGIQCWNLLRYHTCNLVRRATSQALERVASSSQAMSLSRIRSKVSATFLSSRGGADSVAGNLNSSQSRHDLSQRRQKPNLIFSSSECFVSTDLLDNMTLRDMAQVFAYTVQMNQKGFDRSQFLSEARTVTRQVVDIIDQTLTLARGPNVVSIKTSSESGSDSMDALAFAAVARIFAEWRTLRIVPNGYPKFGLGITMARRDLIQNVRKIELAVQSWLDFYQQGVVQWSGRGSSSSSSSANGQQSFVTTTMASPTLRQLLRHEKEVNLHPKLPALTDQSAASGLLWAKRQIEYQSLSMRNNARVPLEFPSPKAAFLAAYEAVYGKYHGFLVKTVFQSTLNAAPPSKAILQRLNMPYLEEAAQANMVTSVPVLSPSSSSSSACSNNSAAASLPLDEDDEDGTWIHVPIEENEQTTEIVEDTRLGSLTSTAPVVSVYHYGGEEGNDTVGEMELGDKVLQVFSLVFGHCVVGGRNHKSPFAQEGQARNATSSFHTLDGSSPSQVWRTGGDSESSSRHCNNGTVRNDTLTERDDLPYYLSVLQSLEGGLDMLLKDLNMNDPTRV